MGEERPLARRGLWALLFILTGAVGILVGALIGPLPSVDGQPGMHSHNREYLRIILQRGTVKVTAPIGRSQTKQLEAMSVA